MDSSFNNLKILFENLKGLGFFGRLFGWNKIRTLLIDASADLQKLTSSIDTLKSENS
ncbi:MAG: hypothetical protein RIA63_01750 [Cyclobacteriaceae bacterium]